MEFDTNGCFLVLMSFTVNLMWGCVAKSLGILLPTLTDQFTTHTWIIGILATLVGVTADITAPLAAVLENKLSCRTLLIFSCAIASVGLLLFPLSSTPVHIALTLAVPVGPGFGIVDVLSKALLGRHFHERYTLACGISHTGQAVALLVFAPMTQLFLDTYGWRGASLLIAGISMHQIASAALVRVSKLQYESLAVSPDNHQASTDDKGGCSSRCAKAYCLYFLRIADVGILLEFGFWKVYMCRFSATLTFCSWLVYFVPHLEAKGFSPQVAAALCSAAAVGYFLGAVVWAPFIDRGVVKCSTAIIVSSLCLTLSFVVDPWLNDIAGYVVTTFVCGLFFSALFTLSDVLVKDIFENDRLVSAFGWGKVFLFAPRFFAGFLPGWIYDSTGSYDLAFIVVGLVPVVCLIPFIIEILRKTSKAL